MDVISVAEPRHVGYEILAHGIGLIALGACFFRPAARIDFDLLGGGQCHVLAQMPDDLVRQQNDRRAESLGVVYRHDRHVERLAHAPWGERDDRMIAVRTPACLHHVALRGRGRLSRRGADALDVRHHAGDLRARGVADQLLFQREARAARRVHDLCPCKRCAENRAHRPDFILHLEECAADLRQQLCHLLGDLRRGRDGVAREERDPCGNRTFGDGLVALHQPSLALHPTPSSPRKSQNRDSASRTAHTQYSPRGARG